MLTTDSGSHFWNEWIPVQSSQNMSLTASVDDSSAPDSPPGTHSRVQAVVATTLFSAFTQPTQQGTTGLRLLQRTWLVPTVMATLLQHEGMQEMLPDEVAYPVSDVLAALGNSSSNDLHSRDVFYHDICV